MKNLLSKMTVCASIMALAGVASAGDPKFKFGKKDEVKEVKKTEWKASAQAGMIVTTGNSRNTTFAGGAKASRKAGNNKLLIEAAGAYAESEIWVFNDANGNGVVDAGELNTAEQPGTKLWGVKVRYDRFLTKHNSLYATAAIGADELAGKALIAGGQVGYSRQLYKSKKHEVVSEIGYDFSYEKPVQVDPTVNIPGVSIHSARVFAGYEGKLSKDTGLSAALEVLSNVNTLDTPTGEVGPGEDTRINTNLALTTKVLKNISFRLAITSKYDNAPSPLPFNFGGNDPILAEKLDTKTEATLIINFL